MSKRAVCICTTAHPAKDTRIFYREGHTLVRAGYDVTLVAPYPEKETVEGVRILPLRASRSRLRRILFAPIRVMVRARRLRVDVYHLHDPELIPLGILLRLFRKKVVLDLHEDLPEQILSKEWLPSLLRWPLSVVVRFGLRLVCSAFSGVVVATDHIAKTIKATSVAVVRNYPPLRAVATNRTPVSQDSGAMVCYVGGLTVTRGILELLGAIIDLPESYNVSLRLIGRPQTAEMEDRIASAVKLFEGRLEWLGWQDPEMVWRLLSKCDIGVVCLHPVPRYQVALPVKLFEYMAAGLPVIASDFKLWRDIIESADCGVCVDPLDSSAIAAVIMKLASDPIRRAEMGQNGMQAVRTIYNWESESVRLIALYERILGS